MAAANVRPVKCKMTKLTSTTADVRHQEENPMRKKCLKAIVQEGHNICGKFSVPFKKQILYSAPLRQVAKYSIAPVETGRKRSRLVCSVCWCGFH